MSIPTGNVTFLFTDIEGSTRLAQEFPDRMQHQLEKHNLILRKAIESNNGFIFEIIGDAFCAAFVNPSDAVKSATDAQLRLLKENWAGVPVKVRMGIHKGRADWNGNRYIGYITLARTQRIMSLAYGGQIIISGETYNSVKEESGARISYRDLGARKLKDLVQPEHLYQVIAEELTQEFPPLKTLDLRPNNLPGQTSSFIGRESEVKEIRSLIKKVRLVTLLGPGGTGKTRLSIKAAEGMIDDYANGVWFVDLSSVSNPANIVKEVISVFNLNPGPERNAINTIIDFLKEKELLLIFDNCEHLIKDCARLAEMFLNSCSKVRIIATSREPLHIWGESVYDVRSMSLPDMQEQVDPESLNQYESVRLFIERALAVRRDFKVTNTNAPALAELCYTLDGIPLAIELAAARIRVLSVESILAKLNDRFSLLTSGIRTALPRQQTLKALIDWSYDLLSDKEKILFLRLSVFSGGFGLEAAEDICSDKRLSKQWILEVLSNLVDKSLVISSEFDGTYRYNMLETIRQYANEKLSGREGLMKKHYDHYLALAERGETRGEHQIQFYKNLKTEMGNLRVALGWSLSKKPQLTLRLANSVGDLWDMNGNTSEGYDIYKIIFSKKIKYDNKLRIYGLINAGYFASQLGELENAEEYYDLSLKLSEETDDKMILADCYNSLGNFHFFKGEVGESKKYHEKSLKISYEINDKQAIALSLVNLASVTAFMGNINTAHKLYMRSLAIYRELKDIISVARVLIQLGNISSKMGRLKESMECYDEAIPILKESGDLIPLSFALLNLGKLSFTQNKQDEAELLFRECLSMAKQYRYTNLHVHSLIKLGYLELARKGYEESKKLFEESLKLSDKYSDKYTTGLSMKGLADHYYSVSEFELSAKIFGIANKFLGQTGYNKLTNEGEVREDRISLLKGRLGEDVFDLHFNEGKKLNQSEAVEFILGED